MVPPASHSHEHKDGHTCGHDHGYTHAHGYSHGPSSPHPAQASPWSILRMTVASRIGAALAVSAGLWAVVLLAMRAP